MMAASLHRPPPSATTSQPPPLGLDQVNGGSESVQDTRLTSARRLSLMRLDGPGALPRYDAGRLVVGTAGSIRLNVHLPCRVARPRPPNAATSARATAASSAARACTATNAGIDAILGE